MSNRLKTLIAHLVVLSVVMIFSVDAHAYEGGYLEGLGFIDGNGKIVEDSYKMTDNDLNTSSGVIQNGMKIVFDSPKRVEKIYFNGSAPTIAVALRFYSPTGVLITQMFPRQNKNDSEMGKTTFHSEGYTALKTPLDNVGQVILYQQNQGWLVKEVDVFGPDATPPQRPVGLQGTLVNAIDRTINLTWKGNTETDFSFYRIFVDGEFHGTSLKPQYTFTGEYGRTYQIHVTAVDYSQNESLPSDTLQLETWPEPIKPVLIAKPDITSIDFSWTESGISYEVWNLYGGVAYKLHTLTEKTYTVFNLEPESTSEYFLVSIDSYGRRTSSEVISVTTKSRPPIQIPVLDVSDIKHDSFLLTWTNPGVGSEILIDGKLVRQIVGNQTKIDQLESETVYKVKVISTDIYGRKAESEEMTAKTSALPSAVLPVLRQIGITHNSVSLTWSNVGNTYEVYLNDTPIKTTKSIVDSLTGLAASTTYTVKVVATDKFGRQNESNVLTVTTPAAPVKPEPKPPTPPPAVSTSKNPEMNKANDQLVQGMNDTKEQGMNVMAIAIMIIIFVFGTLWLIKIFKRKMSKAIPGRNASASGSHRSARRASSRDASKDPLSPKNISATRVSNKNQKSKAPVDQGRRRQYNVEKVYRKRFSKR